MREILRIDDRGRIVIPKSAREYLGIDEKLDNLEKSTDTITLVAIISPESRALRLTSISTGNESLTNLVRSEEVSDARKKGVSELGEDMWNLTTTIVESALRSGDDVVPLEVNKAGRIHTNRVLRNALDLTPESYLIAIPFGRQDGVKELQIIPLLDSSEALIVRIILKDGVEWRIMTPIPEDPEALRKKLLKQKAVQRVDFFL